MADTQEIDKAIGAHGMWKARLRSAIDTGQVDMPVAKIRLDDQCAFGKWLIGPSLAAPEKLSAHDRKVKDLHAEFHRVAATVVEMAQGGQKAAAEKMTALGGRYAEVSGALTAAMMAWKADLK